MCAQTCDMFARAVDAATIQHSDAKVAQMEVTACRHSVDAKPEAAACDVGVPMCC